MHYGCKMASVGRNNRKMQTILSFIVDFLKNNPIHCTSYMAKRSIHWTELLFWIITLLSFMVLSWRFALNLVNIYNSRNAGISYNVDFMKQKSFFPSVTLCPHDILNQTKLNEFSSLSNQFSVHLHNKKAVKIMTEVGICYTINNFISEQLYTAHWSDLNPYPENFTDRFKRENLTFNFANYFPIEEVIEHNIAGNITIYVHSPFDIPTTWSRTGLIVNDHSFKSYILQVYIKEINYDKDFVSQTTPDIRRCRLPNESNLKLFPSVYSRNVCLIECRVQYIRQVCNCIPHFYSNKDWKDYTVCNLRGLLCFSKYFDIFRNIDPQFFKCSHCLPNCAEQVNIIKVLKIKNTTSNRSINKIHHVINNSTTQFFIRRAMYNNLDIIVGLSGVLSTFLGFSVYSLCDLIYFFTVRIFWFRRGYRGSVDEIVF